MSFKIVNSNVPGGTGTQDITSAGFGSLSGAMLFGTNVTGTGGENDAKLVVGATDGTNSFAFSKSSERNVNPSNCWCMNSDSQVFLSLDNAQSTTEDEASFSALITDGIRINWTKVASGNEFSTLLIKNNVQCAVRTVDLGNATGDVTINDLSFEPKVALVYWINGAGADGVKTTVSELGMGIAVNGGSQFSFVEQSKDNVANASLYAHTEDAYGILGLEENGGTAIDFYGEFNNWSSTGVKITISTGGANNTVCGIVFLGNVDADVQSTPVPASNGSESYSGIGFAPEMILSHISNCSDFSSSESGSDANQQAIGVYDGTTVRCFTIFDNDYAQPTNCVSFLSGSYFGTRTFNLWLYYTEIDSLDADGWTWDWQATPASDTRMGYTIALKGLDPIVSDIIDDHDIFRGIERGISRNIIS